MDDHKEPKPDGGELLEQLKAGLGDPDAMSATPLRQVKQRLSMTMVRRADVIRIMGHLVGGILAGDELYTKTDQVHAMERLQGELAALMADTAIEIVDCVEMALDRKGDQIAKESDAEA